MMRRLFMSSAPVGGIGLVGLLVRRSIVSQYGRSVGLGIWVSSYVTSGIGALLIGGFEWHCWHALRTIGSTSTFQEKGGSPSFAPLSLQARMISCSRSGSDAAG